MKTIYYTPTTSAVMVESYTIMAPNSTEPTGGPGTPTDPVIGAPARKLYV